MGNSRHGQRCGFFVASQTKRDNTEIRIRATNVARYVVIDRIAGHFSLKNLGEVK